jgi:hypothetical protein
MAPPTHDDRRGRNTGWTAKLVESKTAATVALVSAVLGIPAALLALSGALSSGGSPDQYSRVAVPAGTPLTAAQLSEVLNQLCAVRAKAGKRFGNDYASVKRSDSTPINRFAANQKQFLEALNALHANPKQQAALERVVVDERGYASLLHELQAGHTENLNTLSVVAVAELTARDADDAYRVLGASVCDSSSREDLVGIRAVANIDALQMSDADQKDFLATVLAFGYCPRYPTPGQRGFPVAHEAAAATYVALDTRRDPDRHTMLVVADPRHAGPWHKSDVASGRIPRSERSELLVRYYVVCGATTLARRLASLARLPYPIGRIDGIPRSKIPRGNSHDERTLRWAAGMKTAEDRIRQAQEATKQLDKALRTGSANVNMADTAAFRWTEAALTVASECVGTAVQPARGWCRELDRAATEAAVHVRAMRAKLEAEGHASDEEVFQREQAEYNHEVDGYNRALVALTAANADISKGV